MSISLKKHLEKARKKAHETQKKNGHFKRMAQAALEKREVDKSGTKNDIL